MRQLNAFFFWISWSCVTERPGQEITYTNNWPAEELVANKPTGALLLWTGFSVIMLIAGIGLMVWYYARRREESPAIIPAVLPLKNEKQTPSQKATVKYFWIVSALLLVQVIMGVITAHYRVEGQAFMVFRLPNGCPIPFPEPGIYRLPFSGLQLPGLQPDFIMHLPFRALNQNFSDWV